MNYEPQNDEFLELAAEEYDPERFEALHVFSDYEERLIRKLVSHGPVLIKGGRGSGKSALLREAARRVNRPPLSSTAFGVYLSLRYLPLLRSVGKDYEHILCGLVSDRIVEVLKEVGLQAIDFEHAEDVSSLHRELAALSTKINKRVILFFDDAAHIGREASHEEFFDIFRTISSSFVSCKASIYPGVTSFGTRFDVYNDATVVDVARNEEQESFGKFFLSVVQKRYHGRLSDNNFSRTLTMGQAAEFIGRAVIGNMRSFIAIFTRLADQVADAPGLTIGLPQLGDTLIDFARDYYWPLITELKPKLGKYEPLIKPAEEVADLLYGAIAAKVESGTRSVLVHRQHVEALAKLLEILEYTGFVMRKEASRGMKSGGRGTRYVANLCNLLEKTPGSRLTKDLFDRWNGRDGDPIEIHKSTDLEAIAANLPTLGNDVDLSILQLPISSLARSDVYPYGLTEQKIEVLRAGGINTVGELADTPDTFLLSLDTIGHAWLTRIRNVVAQAIWM